MRQAALGQAQLVGSSARTCVGGDDDDGAQQLAQLSVVRDGSLMNVLRDLNDVSKMPLTRH